MNGRGAVMMNVGAPSDTHHPLVLNPVVSDPNGSMMIQFLPQRPDEPDCIFFLKNGRCKYGATCRYHHPINYHQRRVDDTRRPRVGSQDAYRVQNVQYVSHLVPAFAAGPGQGVDAHIALLNLEGGMLPPGFKQVSVVSNIDGTTSYAIPVTDQGSSTSSIASSYDTAGSNIELLAAHGESSALWNRARRNGSGGSLNAYSNDSSGRTKPAGAHVLHSSASDGNIARIRSTSYGSASETTYYDAASSTMSRNTSVGSWRTDQTAPTEHVRRVPSTGQFPGRPEDYVMSGATSSQIRMARVTGPRSRHSPRRGPRESDEGFTMMTSALLNMLDTPEEIGASYEDDDGLMYASYPGSPGEIDPAFLEKLSLNERRRVEDQDAVLNGPLDGRWPPLARDSVDGRPRANEDAMQVIHRHASGPSSHSTGDVGLYLP